MDLLGSVIDLWLGLGDTVWGLMCYIMMLGIRGPARLAAALTCELAPGVCGNRA